MRCNSLERQPHCALRCASHVAQSAKGIVQARAGEATEAEDDIMDDESGSDISLSEESDSDSEESEADYDQGQESLTTVGSRYQDKDDQISP